MRNHCGRMTLRTQVTPAPFSSAPRPDHEQNTAFASCPQIVEMQSAIDQIRKKAIGRSQGFQKTKVNDDSNSRASLQFIITDTALKKEHLRHDSNARRETESWKIVAGSSKLKGRNQQYWTRPSRNVKNLSNTHSEDPRGK